MKKVNLFFVILFSVLAFAACEKDPKPEPPEEKAFQNQEFTVNGINFKMIAVEHGFFIKGERTTSSPNQPVQLTNDYYIGETEVTQALWVAVMGEIRAISRTTCKTLRTTFPGTTASVFWKS